MRKIISLIIFLILFVSPAVLFSQVTVTGPVCVIPGTVYQYNIQGTWDSTSTMQICVSGGKIADSTVAGNCTTESAPLGAVLIRWNNGPAGSLTITSSKGNASLAATVTSALLPGEIDSTLRYQMLDSGAVPHTIICSPAEGGSCSPVYYYQWQRSDNAVTWSDIGGATSQSMSFTVSPDQPAYFRRKTTETVSGTIVYCEPALIGIIFKSN